MDVRAFLTGLGLGAVLGVGAYAWSRGGASSVAPPADGASPATSAEAVAERLDARLKRLEHLLERGLETRVSVEAAASDPAPASPALAAVPGRAPAPAREASPVEPSAALVDVVLAAMERAEVLREQRRDPEDALRTAIRRRDDEKDPAGAVTLLRGLLARGDLSAELRRSARYELSMALRASKDWAAAERTLAALLDETPAGDLRGDALRYQQAWNLDLLGRTAEGLALVDDLSRMAGDATIRWNATWAVALLARKSGDAARAQAAFDAIRAASDRDGAAWHAYQNLAGQGFTAR